MLDKNDVKLLIKDAKDRIDSYQSAIFREENIIREIQKECPHELVNNPIGEGKICMLCEVVISK